MNSRRRALGKTIFPLLLSAGDGQIAGSLFKTIQYDIWGRPGRASLARRLREVTEEIARGYRWDLHRAPWPGIASFEAEDAGVFFGRDAETIEIAQRLEAKRVHGDPSLTFIVGASGSGKSSLMKAGLLPYLSRSAASWVIVPPFKPGMEPTRALFKALSAACGDDVSMDATSGPQLALLRKADALRRGTAREATVLVSIDQFEELFTVASRVARDEFLTLFEPPTDRLGDILGSGGLRMPHEALTVGSLPSVRIRSVIEGPARVAAIELGEGLVDRVIADVESSSNVLPLLAFALREMHDRHRGAHSIALADYEELGDPSLGLRPIENVVRRKAEEAMADARPTLEELSALKEAFVGEA